MSWNAFIDIKANGKLNQSEWSEVHKWAEVDQVWSTSGTWDWMLKLKDSVKSMDELEKLVFKLRALGWVSETRTWWAKSV